jgi:hypothetical protein
MGAEVVEGKNPVEEGPNLADMEVHKNPSEEEVSSSGQRNTIRPSMLAALIHVFGQNRQYC